MKALALVVCASVATFACSTEPAAVRVEEHHQSAEGETAGSSRAYPLDPSAGSTTTTVLIESPTTSITSPTTTTTEAESETTSTVRPATTTTVRPTQLQPVVHGDATMDALAECESGDSNANTGNGYFGYLQFSLPTWRGMGESGYPTDYGRSYQFVVGWRLQARSGWGQWPACARMLGLV